MAFLMESHLKSKGKRYDRNGQIHMTGEDCRLLEMSIGKFVQVLCHDKPLAHSRNKTLQHVVSLCTKFHDLATDL